MGPVPVSVSEHPAPPGKALGLANLVRNSGILYGSTVAVMGIGVATKVLQAHLLTARDLGVFLTAQTLATLAATAAQLSVPEALVRFIGRSGRANMGYAASLVEKALWAATGSGVVLLVTAFLARNLISALYHDQNLGSVLLLLMMAVPFNAAALVFCSAYRGFGEIWEKVAYIDTIPAIVILAGIALAGIARRSSLETVAGVYLAGSLISFALSALHFFRDREFRAPKQRAATGELLRFSLPLLASQMVAWPMAMIPLMLGVKNLDGVAYYNIALALASLSYTLVGAAETAALPVWSSRIGSSDASGLRKDYAVTTSWCFLASSLAFAVLFFRAPDVIGILYGKQYVAGAPVVRCIAPFFLLNAATGPNESLLKAFGATRWIFASRLACGAGVVLATLAFRSADSLTRALAGYWIASLAGLLMYAIYLAVVYKIHPLSVGFAQSAVSVMASLLAVSFVQPWVHLRWGALNLVATSLVYGSFLLVMLWVTGYLSREEVPGKWQPRHGRTIKPRFPI
jgi:O-antigen/teichoic acid export membrane protein